MTFDSARWQARLDELRAAHRVPGASLAVLVDGNVHELASGVLHRATGVEVTTDSVFLSGSLAKVCTATLVMQLVDSGELELDTPVVSVLPEFATPDPEATKTITIRRLLSHTGGLTCDFTYCWPTAAAPAGCTPACSGNCWASWPGCACRTPSDRRRIRPRWT